MSVSKLRGEKFKPAKGDRDAWYAYHLQRMRNYLAKRADFSDRTRLNWLLSNPEVANLFRNRSEIDKRMRDAIRQGVELDGRRKA